MNDKQLQDFVGKKVITERRGIQSIGVLISIRRMFGRTEGQVKFPKGFNPPKHWFWSNKISPIEES